jgi:hypothetical protein
MKAEPGWFVRRVLIPCLSALGWKATPAVHTAAGPGVALLIDGENCAPELAASALEKAENFGVVRVRRVYANWASANHRGWMDVVARYRLEPIHHARMVTGKNATDIALVVDAMDLLHLGEIACFCLVASDSDYTPLVQRLRAANRIVVGLGRAQTASALTEACSVFLTLEASSTATAPTTKKALTPTPAAKKAVTAPTPAMTKVAPAATDSAEPSRAAFANGATPPSFPAPASEVAPAPTPPSAPTPVVDPGPILLAAWEAVARARGEVSLSNLVLEVQRSAPTLRPKDYGHTKLAQLIRQRTDLFVIQSDKASPGVHIVRKVQGEALSGGTKPIEALLLAAWERAPKQDGWLFIGILGQHLKQLDPDFDPRRYGYSRLGLLLQAHPNLFELRKRSKGQYDLRLRQVARKG